MSVTVERAFHVANRGGRRGGCRHAVLPGTEPPPAPPPKHSGRVPRIARLMALAIRCDQLIRSGAVPDASTMARLAHVSQPRMTQILNLTLLAPDIQEALLFLPEVQKGSAPIGEKALRVLCGHLDWQKQRDEWRAITRPASPS